MGGYLISSLGTCQQGWIPSLGLLRGTIDGFPLLEKLMTTECYREEAFKITINRWSVLEQFCNYYQEFRSSVFSDCVDLYYNTLYFSSEELSIVLLRCKTVDSTSSLLNRLKSRLLKQPFQGWREAMRAVWESLGAFHPVLLLAADSTLPTGSGTHHMTISGHVMRSMWRLFWTSHCLSLVCWSSKRLAVQRSSGS